MNCSRVLVCLVCESLWLTPVARTNFTQGSADLFEERHKHKTLEKGRQSPAGPQAESRHAVRKVGALRSLFVCVVAPCVLIAVSAYTFRLCWETSRRVSRRAPALHSSNDRMRGRVVTVKKNRVLRRDPSLNVCSENE